MSGRNQRGYLYLKSGSWYLRYYDGATQRARRLASHTDCRNKTAARVLADEFLRPLNADGQQMACTMGQFVEETYLPAAESQKRASTSNGYRNIWNCYLASPIGDMKLRDFRLIDAERTLQLMAPGCELSRTTLGHIKAFLSGIFHHAKRLGLYIGENPMHGAGIPSGRAPRETYAYSLEEIGGMLRVLPEPAATIVAVAAFTGVRRGELRGLAWENYDGMQICITRAYWRDKSAEPKTARSKAPVPIIPQLAARLDRLRKVSGSNVGLMFPGEYIKNDISPLPIDLDALARHVIAPALLAHGLKWHGWHAFRRGLATNLHHLGVPDKVIQGILRHANVAVTQACYIKVLPADVTAAMGKLAASVI